MTNISESEKVGGGKKREVTDWVCESNYLCGSQT